jgi:hypothetical protein
MLLQNRCTELSSVMPSAVMAGTTVTMACSSRKPGSAPIILNLRLIYWPHLHRHPVAEDLAPLSSAVGLDA